MTMSNLNYNATKILAITFFFLLQDNIYYFLFTRDNLAKKQSHFHSLQVRCQGNFLWCHTITGWMRLEWASWKHPVQALPSAESSRASGPGTASSCNSTFRQGWDASNEGDSTTCAAACALCLWAALRRAWLCPLCSLPSDIYLNYILSELPLL